MAQKSVATEDLERAVPREMRIAKALPAISPRLLPPPEAFQGASFANYQVLVRDVMPKFQMDRHTLMSDAIQAIKSALESATETCIFDELMMRHYLVACQAQLTEFIASPSLTKLSLLHNELVQAYEVIHAHNFRADLGDFCLMMISDILDIYQSRVSEAIDGKFWAKAKSVEDLVTGLLKRECERLKLLNPKSCAELTNALMRSAVNGAPNSAVDKLRRWGATNNYKMD